MATPMELLKKKREEAHGRVKDKGYLSKKKVYVGNATCEVAAGADQVMDVFSSAVKDGLTDVYLSQKGCAGRCNLEPTVEVIEDDKAYKYIKVSADMAKEIIERHIKKGEVISEWLGE